MRVRDRRAALCLQIDTATKPRVELDLQLLHLLSDGSKLLLEHRDFLFDLPCRAGEHLLDFGQGQGDEGVADLISGVCSQ
jgi:hypothetical protein